MSHFDESRMPVLVGCGQITDKSAPDQGMNPIELMVEASRRACADAGDERRTLDSIDTLIAIGMVVDEESNNSPMAGSFSDPPRLLSQDLGINPTRSYYTDTGGNTPQMIINKFAEEIAQGKTQAVMISGAEALGTMIGRLKQGLSLDDWHRDTGTVAEHLGSWGAPTTPHEFAHGIANPVNAYPMFENALRGKYGLSLEEHQHEIGELYAGLNGVAARNPDSWFPTARSAEEIATPSPDNRYVGFPYTKYLNSVIRVNMGAAVVMMSAAQARAQGISSDRWVYLRGCGDANDLWYMYQRANFHSSPAIRLIGKKAMQMAGCDIDDIEFFDLYSCFPSAVQIARDELGMKRGDSRQLSLTGGLPYFGGPGNNYVTHSVGAAMRTLRENPGSYGLVNANGWYITKHSLGIYSTEPPTSDWHREDPQDYAADIQHQDIPAFTETPEGTGTVETYTVMHGRKGIEQGIVFGRLGDGTRFLANTPEDPGLLQQMVEREMLGCSGTVSQRDGKNLFEPDMG